MRRNVLLTLDVLYFLAYLRTSDRSNAFMAAATVVVMVATGALVTAAEVSGIDFVEAMERIYPFQGDGIPQSPFKRTAAPAVLFTLPMALLCCLFLYRRAAADLVIQRLATVGFPNSFLPGFMIFLAVFFGLAATFLVSDRVWVLPLQLLLIAFTNAVISNWLSWLPPAPGGKADHLR
jgi:hypothetical protein